MPLLESNAYETHRSGILRVVLFLLYNTRLTCDVPSSIYGAGCANGSDEIGTPWGDMWFSRPVGQQINAVCGTVLIQIYFWITYLVSDITLAVKFETGSKHQLYCILQDSRCMMRVSASAARE
jgi:hypothetical protein